MATLKYIADPDLMTVTLDSAYTAASGAMALTAGHGARLPSAGDFWLRTTTGTYQCFKVTARSTDALTVTAAQDGTSDGNLDAGTELKWVLGATAFDQFRADLVQSGAYATLPSGEKAGQLYIPTDSAYDLLRYSGAAWQHFRGGKLLTPPTLGDFSWVNQESASAVATYGGIHLSHAGQTGTHFNVLVKAAPSPPYTITAAFESHMQLNTNAWNSVGLIFRQSSDGKLVPFLYMEATNQTAGVAAHVGKCTNPTTYAGDYSGPPYAWKPLTLLWMRITDNGTNRVCSMSDDGVTWRGVHTIDRTDFLTADQVGFYINAAYAAPLAMWLLHWSES